MWSIVMIAVVVIVILIVLYLLRPTYRPNYLLDLRDIHIVITGGSSGIGKELARQLLNEHHARVTILARNQKRLDECQEELNPEKNDRLLCLSVDVGGVYSDVQKAIERACVHHGNRPVTILINNAAIYYAKVFNETSADDFEQMSISNRWIVQCFLLSSFLVHLVRINYLGSIYCTKACLPSMKKLGFGRIAFISSQAGQVGVFGYTSYCGTKFALKGLAESLQMELARENIFVTVAYPPDTDTPGFAEENKTKPVETRLINETSGLLSATEVARGIIQSVQKGSVSCWFGINGFLLNSLTSGAQPITSILELISQSLTIGLARLIIIGLLNSFYGIARKVQINKTKAD